MSSLRSLIRFTAASMMAALALALLAGMPASAAQSDVEALRETRLGSSPGVEPLTNSRRAPLPLLRQDQQRLRRTEPALRCSYLRGRRVCR